MPLQVVNGAQLSCTFGTSPSTLTVLPAIGKQTLNQPSATIMDSIPMTNIMPFGMCSSIANPQVAAATSAALGTLTPQPCIPATASPWTPGSPTTQLGTLIALNNTSTCTCSYGGMVAITDAGQTAMQIP